MGGTRTLVKYWLLKSEPGCYSIDNLKKDEQTYWDGVRNYQARNFIKNEMQVGDEVLFYHSNATPSGIAGLATISKIAYPDFTAQEPTEDHYDPKSTPENPIWWMVDIQYKAKFTTFLGLPMLHQIPELAELLVLKKGSRLSVMPVEKHHYTHILELEKALSK